MSEFAAKILWQRAASEAFVDNQYSRAHHWSFDGGVVVPASASPHIVPLPLSVAENVDPEEAFVAALSSCHMLFFLSFAAKKRYCVDFYQDDASGRMARDAQGREWVGEVILRPEARFSGERRPSDEIISKLHHLAHEACFIANSVKSNVHIEPVV
ncbi:OsmC family protein [Simiduia sp. 21SJ11W-1]|uniref:OsmC family protein n=1 Tax=Simiduia sp. 21SJ11W-1 TaxID=2909669 RepID=UPI00209EE2A5|nr:OsmC family protein [Simiduia sp. 21SJ11W-1]UTA48161.1 OsmC family protein [Simiduia sp. 21SJ11W-1]